MIGNAPDPETISSVTPRAIQAYLASHGWRHVDTFGDAGNIYGLENVDQEILVPVTVLGDYTRRISEILETLSYIEERDSRAILRDLSLTDFDLVRVRQPDAAADGSLAINAGVALITESRNLLLAAACATVRSQRAFRAGRIREANEYLHTVRLGQTERGSFVVNLLLPIPPDLGYGQADMDSGSPPDPFERQVTRKLVSGLRATRDAVVAVNRGNDIRAFENEVHQGVSANLCDAIAGLLDYGAPTSLDVSVSWAPVRVPTDERARIQFTTSDLTVLKEASRILKDRQEYLDERVEGYVTALAREQAQHTGRVTIKGVIDGVMSSIRVDFEPDDYRQILTAHEQRRVVSLQGDLRREGQRWVLQHPRDLMVLEDDDDE